MNAKSGTFIAQYNVSKEQTLAIQLYSPLSLKSPR